MEGGEEEGGLTSELILTDFNIPQLFVFSLEGWLLKV